MSETTKKEFRRKTTVEANSDTKRNLVGISSVMCGLAVPIFGPVSLLAVPLIYLFSKKTMEHEAKKRADIPDSHSKDVVNEWLRNKQPDETRLSTSLDVRNGPGSGFIRTDFFEFPKE